jgi:hypothetical protein
MGFRNPIKMGFGALPEARTASGAKLEQPLSLTQQILTTLPPTLTTDLHFVADDWAGSGNWAARIGGWSAVVSGAPTKQACPQFPGRSEITGFLTTAYFKTATNTAHSLSTAMTFELVVKIPAVNATYQMAFSMGNGVANGGSLFYLDNVNGLWVSPVDSGGVARHNTTFAGAAFTTKYALVTVVIQQGASSDILYLNGVQRTTGTAGTFGSSALAFAIGADTSNNFPWGGTVLEVMRHRSALSATDIAARAALLTRLKGY